MKSSKKFKILCFISASIWLFFTFVSVCFSEVRTTYTEAEYWKSSTNDNKVVKRYLYGRTVENNLISVKNVSFNRGHHSFGKGDVLSVTFDIVNKVNKPFEGYLFVVADNEKRFKKGAHFYVLISNISPDPDGKTKDFAITSGVLPDYAKKIASSKSNSKLLGVLTKEELMKNYANDPSQGIPIRVSEQTQIDVKHFIPYARDEDFFNHVLILIYGKEKEKMISYELRDDPKRIGEKKLIHIKKDSKTNKTEYIIKEHYPLYYAKRYKLTKR